VAEVNAIIRSVYATSFTTQINLRLIASANWPNVIETKIAIRQMTYLVIDVVPSSHSCEQSNKEDDSGDSQWDGKTHWDHLPKVKVINEQLGVITSNKSQIHISCSLTISN
jgi:hypothetical protein